MKYSEYANEWLVELHKDLSGGLKKRSVGERYDNYGKVCPRPEWEVDLVGALVDSRNDSYMRSVWSAIRKRMDDEDRAGPELYSACVIAFDWEQKITPHEKKRRLLAISQKARELAAITDKRSYENSCGYFAMMDSLRIDSSTTAYEVRPDGMYWDDLYLPSLSYILNDFADKLETESKMPPPSARPNRDNAHYIVFVRSLTASMREQFGQPLVATVANTASVIFGKDIDENFVRNNTRDLVPDCNGGGTK